MKHPSLASFSFSLVVVSAAAFLAGCSRQDRAEIKADARDVYHDSVAALDKAWDSAKAYSFDKRREFAASANSLRSRMDAQISSLRADYSEAKASNSRRAAMTELKECEGDFQTKLDALNRATVDTWESAKQNAIASWDRLQAAYYKARTR